MPDGLIVMKYDERSGIDILAKYPMDELEVSNKTLMHVLNLHEFSEKPGCASLTLDNTNFVTYYSGSEIDYFFILLLNILEDPEDYEAILKEVSNKILENLEKKNYEEILPSLFKQIQDYPKNRNTL